MHPPLSEALFRLLAVLFVQAFAEEIDLLFGRVHSSKDQDGQDRQLDAGDVMIGPDGDADRRQDPDTGGRGDPDDDAVPREDHARPQKADARDDLADDTQVQGRLLIDTTKRREDIDADADQYARSDADGLAGDLTLKTDDRSRDHCTKYFGPAKRRYIENGVPNSHRSSLSCLPDTAHLYKRTGVRR